MDLNTMRPCASAAPKHCCNLCPASQSAQWPELRLAGRTVLQSCRPGDCRPCSARHTALHAVNTQERPAETTQQVDEVDLNMRSHPQVEVNMKVLGRSLLRIDRWPKDAFAIDAEYKDPLRSFKGRDKYQRLKFRRECIQNPKIVIKLMRMESRSRGIIDFRCTGKVQPGSQQVDIDGKATFDFSLTTGAVLRHEEDYSYDRMSATARAAYTARRAAWAAAQLREDLQERLNKDSPRSDIQADPTDPTKFFQQQDTTFQDGVTFATILAVLWLLVTAFYKLETTKGL